MLSIGFATTVGRLLRHCSATSWSSKVPSNRVGLFQTSPFPYQYICSFSSAVSPSFVHRQSVLHLDMAYRLAGFVLVGCVFIGRAASVSATTKMAELHKRDEAASILALLYDMHHPPVKEDETTS